MMATTPVTSSVPAPVGATTVLSPRACLLARGITAPVLDAFGVRDTTDRGRPAVRYPVRLPDGAAVDARVKYTDGRKPKARWWGGQDGRADPIAPRLLYGADLTRPGLSTLFLVEGEPDVWLMRAAGLPAVSLLGGATCGLSTHAAYAIERLAPGRVLVIYDADAPGLTHGPRVAASITASTGLAATALRLPGALGEGGDVTDLFAATGRDPGRFAASLAALPAIRAITARQAAGARHDPRPARSGAVAAGGGRFDDFKRSHPLALFVERLTGQAGRPCGPELVWRCPLPGHDDRTPSFFVNASKGLFLCRGCGRGGDVITLLQLLGEEARVSA